MLLDVVVLLPFRLSSCVPLVSSVASCFLSLASLVCSLLGRGSSARPGVRGDLFVPAGGCPRRGFFSA